MASRGFELVAAIRACHRLARNASPALDGRHRHAWIEFSKDQRNHAAAGAKVEEARPPVDFSEQVGLFQQLIGAAISPSLPDPVAEGVAGNHRDWLRADEARAVYEGVQAMTPDDIAECILFAVTRPPHVNVDELVVKALAQSSGGRILRSE